MIDIIVHRYVFMTINYNQDMYCEFDKKETMAVQIDFELASVSYTINTSIIAQATFSFLFTLFLSFGLPYYM